MKRKLSQTKSAIARRKMRASETSSEKEMRLSKRRASYRAYLERNRLVIQAEKTIPFDNAKTKRLKASK